MHSIVQFDSATKALGITVTPPEESDNGVKCLAGIIYVLHGIYVRLMLHCIDCVFIDATIHTIRLLSFARSVAVSQPPCTK